MTDRLTKNELTWLLTQEARTAAQKLRQGVAIISSSGEHPVPPTATPDETSGGVETTLNQLDEAVSMLASLHGHASVRGRRGKIDIAALVWEVAPEARVQLEMGEGTTVFGDEAELRRMLHVLISQSGDPLVTQGTPGVTIRRDGEEVRVGVNLGPDTPATLETERGWLSRMAHRYGGRLELDGSMQTLVLAADVDTHRREMESLQKELAAAQAQGEVYARELAAMWSRDSSQSGALSSPPIVPGTSSRFPLGSADGLPVLVAGLRALGADLRGILSAIGRDIAPLRDRGDEVSEIAASVGRHVTGASEVVADLTRIGACPIGELPRHADVADLIREVCGDTLVVGRAARHDVNLIVNASVAIEDAVPVASLTVLVQALLDHAINATPPGLSVVVTLAEETSANAIVLMFDDAGPPVPAAARSSVFSREFEAIARGRPRALSLIVAFSVAAHLRYSIDIDESPQSGTRVRVTIPRVSLL